MANEVDGSIVVDTQLDDEGFKAGSAELLNAIKSLSTEVHNLGESIKNTFNGDTVNNISSSSDEVQKLENRIKELEAQSESLRSKTAELQEQLKAVGSAEVKVNTSDAENKVAGLEAEIERLKNVLAEMQAAANQNTTSPTGATTATVTPQVKVNANEFTAIEKEINSVNASIEKLGPTLQRAMSGNENAMSSFNAKADILQNKIREITQRIADLGNTNIPTEAYQQVTNELDKAEKKLLSLYDKQDKMQATGVQESSRAWQALQYDIQNATEAVERCERAKEQMESAGTAYQMGVDTEAYTNLENALDTVNQKLNELRETEQQAEDIKPFNDILSDINKVDENADKLTTTFERLKANDTAPNSSQWKNLSFNIQSTIEQLDRYSSVLSSLRDAGAINDSQFQQATAAISAARDRMSELASETNKAKRENTLLSKVGQGLKKAFSSVGSLVKNLRSAKKESNGCGSAISALGKKLGGLGSMIKRMAIRKILNAAFSGVKEGVNNLAQYSSGMNASLSSIKSELTQLKNSLATAFAPILTVVTPILATLINYLSSAITYVGKFVAALTGASTFTKAKAVQEDYAASLDKTGAAAKKAQKQLAGFDDLNVINDSNADSGAGSGISPADMFEEVPIESKITDFVNRLKDAFKNGEYDEIGSLIGGKINSAVQKINDFVKWDNVGGKITTFVNGVTGTLNSLVTAVDWALIGDIFAQGINTLINTANLLVTGIKWDNIGTAFTSGLNGLVHGIDWNKYGETIGAGLQGALSFLHAVVTTFDFNGLTSGIGNAINSGVKAINWAMVGDTISSGFKNIVGAIGNLAKTIDFKNIGASIATALNNIDWPGMFATLAKSVSNILKSALDLLIGFAEKLDWGKLGKDIWNSIMSIITNIDWSGIISRVFQLLGAALGGLTKLVVGLAKEFWECLKIGFEATKEYFSKYIDEAGGNVIKGLFKGIGNALKNIGSWIVENIFKPFINGFKNAFGIHSPSTVMAELGGFLIEGLLNGISAMWEAVKNFFTGAFEGIKNLISDAWNGIKDVTSIVWGGIKDTASNIWGGITGHISENLENAKTIASEAWSNIKDTAVNIGENIKTGVSEAWGVIKTHVTDNLNNARTLAGTAWDGIKSKATEIGNNIKTHVSETWDNVKSNITEKLSAAKTGASEVWDGIKSKATEIGNGIKNKVSDAWSNIKDSIKNNIENARTIAGTAWDNIKSKASTLNDNIKSKVNEAWTAVKDNVKDRIENARTIAGTAWENMKNTASTVGTNIKNGVSTAWTAIKDNVKSNIENARTLAGTAWDGIKSKATEIGNSIKTHVSDTWTNIRDSISNKLSSAHTLAINTWNGIKGTASSTVESIKTTVSTAYDSLKTTVSSKMESIKATASNIWTNIKNDATTWGRDICSNLANGIESGVSWVEGKVQGLASGIKSFLGFSEPEKGPLSNFHTYMPDMLKLMAEGIDKNKGIAINAVSDLAGAISNEAKNSETIIPISTESVMDSKLNGVLSNFSDKVSNSFMLLIDRLSAIADKVTFAMPAVATGAVVPYTSNSGVKVNQPYDGNDKDHSNDRLNAVIGAIEKLEKKFDEVVEAIDSKETGISDSDIYRSVKKSANAESKATGRSPF